MTDDEFYEWKCNYDWENNPDDICPECFYPGIKNCSPHQVPIEFDEDETQVVNWVCCECGSFFVHKGSGYVNKTSWGKNKAKLESYPSDLEICKNDY